MKKRKSGTSNNVPDRPLLDNKPLTDYGEPRPVCKCHSLPMKHGDKLKNGEFRWRCRVKDAANQERFRTKRLASGCCIVCMTQPSALGSVLCESCRNRGLIYDLDKTIEKYSRLNALDKDDPEYIAIVRREKTIG